jgi:hypothetical protein
MTETNSINSIIINKKTYKVQKLDVMETLYLHAEAMHLMGDLLGNLLELYVRLLNKEKVDIQELGTCLAKADPHAIRILAPKIYAQVITPENQFLSDASAVENWFSRKENKADVWEVLVKAANVLLGEYLPEFLKGTQETETKPEA